MMSSKEQKTPDEQVSPEIDMAPGQEADVLPETAEVLDPRDEQIAVLEAKLEELKLRERDSLLRAKAEMENVRRRAELDVEKAHKFALEKFAGELLPIVDSLERGLELSNPDDESIRPMREGIELTLKMFQDTLKRYQ